MEVLQKREPHFVCSAAPGPVYNFKSEITEQSVVLSWEPPLEPNGVILIYEVTYSVNGSIPFVSNTTTGMRYLTILSLPLGTVLSNISVTAYTSEGRGETAYLDPIMLQLDNEG